MNNEMLEFDKQTMNEDQFRKLYKSYRQLFWLQLSLPIATVLITALLCIIFNQYAKAILTLGCVAFIFLFIIWLIISQFVVGKLWHKYAKLYKSGEDSTVIKVNLFG